MVPNYSRDMCAVPPPPSSVFPSLPPTCLGRWAPPWRRRSPPPPPPRRMRRTWGPTSLPTWRTTVRRREGRWRLSYWVDLLRILGIFPPQPTVIFPFSRSSNRFSFSNFPQMSLVSSPFPVIIHTFIIDTGAWLNHPLHRKSDFFSRSLTQRVDCVNCV